MCRASWITPALILLLLGWLRPATAQTPAPLVIFPPGTQSEPVTGFMQPEGVAVDSSGNLYVTDAGSNALYKEMRSGSTYTQSVIANNFILVWSVALDKSGNVYVADIGDPAVGTTYYGAVYKETGAGSSYVGTQIGGSFVSPDGIAVDSSGNIYVADFGCPYCTPVVNGGLYKLTPSGSTYTKTQIGSGLNNVSGVTVDSSGNVYPTDWTNYATSGTLYKETLSGSSYTQSVVSSNFITPVAVAVDPSGDLYVADDNNLSGTGADVYKETLSGGNYTQSTLFNNLVSPEDLVLDASGNLYLAVITSANSGIAYAGAVYKQDYADPPSLSFGSVNVGSTSSTQTVTVENIGNAALDFEIPSSGKNPSIAPGFTLASGSGSDCPLVTSSSSTEGTLDSGASCTLPITFAPQATGSYSGSTLVLTDNNANQTSPYATQTITLSGTGTGTDKASYFTVTGASSVTAGTQTTITVKAEDALGNLFTGYSGTVHFTSSDGSAVLPANSTLTSGVGTFSVTLKTAGNQTVTATDTTTSSVTGSAAITVNAGSATHLAVSAPSTATAGTSFTFTVYAYDAYGNLVSSDADTVHFTSTDSAASLPANSPLSNGEGSFTATLHTGGSQTITATDITNSTIQGTSNTITVSQPPTISLAFGATSIPVGGVTTLTATITNPNAGVSLSGVSFTNVLPTGLTIATPNGLTNTCGGTAVVATSGNGFISLSGASLSANGSCALNVNVTGTTAGAFFDTTSAVTSSNGGAGNTASASLTVLAPPTNLIVFGAATIPVGGTTTLTDTIANPNTSASLTGVSFTNVLPAGLTIATPNGLISSCGGTASATSGSGSISLAGGSLSASSSCTVTVTVKAVAPGVDNDTTGAVSSTNGGTGNTASASITITQAAPSVTQVAPTSGPVTGGTLVTIIGTNFTGATVVLFGGSTATSFTVISSTSIAATSPAGTGTVDVTVATPAGTSTTNPADQFSYFAPVATSLTPAVTPGTTFVYGTQPTISVAVSPLAVTGTLTATLDGSALSAITVNGAGNYSVALPATPLTVGSHSIALVFTGTGVYQPSTSNISLTVTTPTFVVNTASDDASGVASNCTSSPEGTCTLRDALAAAATATAGNITFDSTVFASPQTITLGSAGTLTIPTNTTITGATSGNGATLQNLVTVSGNNANTVFAVSSGVTGAAIANLIVTGGFGTDGGGINNSGTLTVTGSVVTANKAEYSGGGIANNGGTLTVTGSTVTGNGAQYIGAISNTGTLTVIDSTFYGNFASGGIVGGTGGGINNGGTLTVIGSTFFGNSATGDLASGGGIYNTGTLALSNTVLSGNTGGDLNDQTGVTAIPALIGSGSCSGVALCNAGGNVVGVYNGATVNSAAIDLALLSNFGGPTQTMIPLPGSPAICAGTVSPGGGLTLPTTDQRGHASSNATYIPGTTCVDAGAVQTNYSLSWSAAQSVQPPALAVPGVALSPAPAVTLNESGTPFSGTGVTIPLTLVSTPAGATLSGGSASTSAGVASYSSLSVNQAGTDDQLTATLALNTSPALSISATSGTFNVGPATPTLSFTPSPNTQVYGSAITSGALDASASYNSSNVAGAFTYTTIVNGSTETLVAGATVLPVGTYTLTANFIPSSTTDYTAASLTATYIVNPSAVTASVTANNKTYNASTAATTACTLTGIALADAGNVTCSASSASFATKNVGAGITVTATGISLSGSASGNYSLSSTTATTTANITAAPLTITATTNTKVYDATTSAVAVPTVGAGQLQGSDTVSGLAELYASANAGTGKTLNVSAYTVNDGNAGKNYQVTTAPNTTGVINPAAVTVSVTASNKIYDGTATATITGCALTGVLVADAGNVTCSTSSATFAASGVGNSVAVTATGITLSGSASANYQLSSTTATTTANITQATLTITAGNGSFIYGGAVPAIKPSYSGFTGTDSSASLTAPPTCSTTATSASPVGSYTSTCSGAVDANYAVSYLPGSVNVTQAASATTLAVGSTSITPGESVTLTATVMDASAGSTGTPTGAISFYDGGTLLNTTPAALSGGVASYATAALAPGVTHTITATYSGDVNFTGGSSTPSSATNITVAPLDFTMTLAGPANLTVVPGQSISYQVTVTPDYGSYAGTVNFAVSGLPPGATVTISPTSIAANSGPQTVTVTIQTAPVTVLNREQPQTGGRKLAPIALGFLFLIGAGTLRKRGKMLRGLLCVLVLIGAGAASTMISGCGSNGGFFAQPPQNYSVTVTATAANLQHSATITLNVQ